jgi:hypothetical protein
MVEGILATQASKIGILKHQLLFSVDTIHWQPPLGVVVSPGWTFAVPDRLSRMEYVFGSFLKGSIFDTSHAELSFDTLNVDW